MNILVYSLAASFYAAKTSLPRGTSGIRAASEKPFCVSLLKIGEADTRHEQKLPAGVLFARRGLIFVK